MELIEILRVAVKRGASDIHIVIGRPPMARVTGKMVVLPGFPVLSAEESKRLIYSMLYDAQKQQFEDTMELDCSFAVSNMARFRVNVFRQLNGVEAVLRIIPSVIPEAEALQLSPTILDLAALPRGLVLVAGHTGCGKSTTLACLIDRINSTEEKNIITVEDPIEFVFSHKKSVVRQREVGLSTTKFSEALKHALRQDPDVILVGEMRDLETISLAITAAETGHLCFATLHVSDAAQTVDRIVDVFPAHQQEQVRVQLSIVLRGVINQTLLPRLDGNGLVAAREIMIVTPAIANLIREGKSQMIPSAIETGNKFGMVTMDRALADLVNDGTVGVEAAMAKCSDQVRFMELTRSAGRSMSQEGIRKR